MVESVGRRPTTTTTGGALSDPDLRAASFSQEGVVDRSGIFRGEATASGLAGISKGISEFGQMALDLDEGIAKAQLEKNLLDEFEYAVETRQPDFAEKQVANFEDASVDLRVAEQKQELLKNDLGEGGAIETLAPEFADITNRLEKAKRRGAMSLDEFEIRTREALRRAIVKRPGLINELTRHAEDTLSLSGARERLRLHDKLQASEGQAEAARRDRVIKQLDRANQPFSMDSTTERLETQLNTFREQEVSWEGGKRLREMKQNFDQEEGLSLLREHGRFVGAGAYNEFSQEAGSLFTPNMSASDFTNAKLQLNAVLAKKTAEINELGRKSGVTNTPEFKDFRDNWLGAMKSLSDTLQGAANGDEVANITKNQMTVIQGQWQRGVYDAGFNPDMARIANLMSPWVEADSLFKRQPHLQEKFAPMFENLMLGSVNSPALSRVLHSTSGTTSDLANILDSALKGSVPEDITKPGNRAAIDFEKMVNTSIEVIDKEIGKDPTIAFQAMTDTIRKLGDPTNRSRMANATDATKNQLVELGVKQASALEPARNRFLDNAREQGVIIRPRTLPNGSLQFFTEGDTPKDRALLKEFDSKFGRKYNDLIKFKSTLFGMSVPQTAELLGDIYSGGSVEDVRNAIDTRRQKLNQAPKEVIDLIKSEEGFRENAYLDQGGVPTIGYGFTNINGRPVQMGDSISREQAERELHTQVQKHSAFKEKLKTSLTEEQMAALSSFEYNLGPGIWDKSGKSIIDAINRGELEAAAEVMSRHTKVRDPQTGELKENRGLVKRREREVNMLLGSL